MIVKSDFWPHEEHDYSILLIRSLLDLFLPFFGKSGPHEADVQISLIMEDFFE